MRRFVAQYHLAQDFRFVIYPRVTLINRLDVVVANKPELVRMMSDVVREKLHDRVVGCVRREYVTWLGDSGQSNVPS
jgi:hypothetical protein